MIRIDIISDVMCPWCYIGKRNLDMGLKAFLDKNPDEKIAICWRPYQLDATLPEAGKDRQTYLNDKFGGPESAGEIYGRIEAAGTNIGIPFRFDLIEKSPNTVNAHRTLLWANEVGLQHQLAEQLFIAYFLEGRDLSQITVLADIASEAGLDRDDILEKLKTDDDKDNIAQMVTSAHQMGVSGVPFFILNRQHGLSGAQPQDVWVKVLTDLMTDK